ncbi:MAG TPA: hypothetical protein H9903_10580 [Candidatus Aquabacterium excrementipullorum]|nr:hypothetical protein [Candidatus Aquabacterium excrementipullorum]
MTFADLMALGGLLSVPTGALVALLFRTEARITRLETIVLEVLNGTKKDA